MIDGSGGSSARVGFSRRIYRLANGFRRLKPGAVRNPPGNASAGSLRLFLKENPPSDGTNAGRRYRGAVGNAWPAGRETWAVVPVADKSEQSESGPGPVLEPGRRLGFPNRKEKFPPAPQLTSHIYDDFPSAADDVRSQQHRD